MNSSHMTNKNHKIYSLLFAFLWVTETKTFSQAADIILTNGKIFTADTNQLHLQAIAIKGNKILATGSNADMGKYTSSETREIDLEGKTPLIRLTRKNSAYIKHHKMK